VQQGGVPDDSWLEMEEEEEIKTFYLNMVIEKEEHKRAERKRAPST
jgi:hypothetical protein